jgi:DNA-binding CsgD family transcriptional regulator
MPSMSGSRLVSASRSIGHSLGFRMVRVVRRLLLRSGGGVSEPTRPSGGPQPRRPGGGPWPPRAAVRPAGVPPGPAGDWPLVGRREELELVETVLRSGRVGGVVIAGAAGVGKSRLAAEGAARALAGGMAVERVFATRASASIPFGAVAHLLPPVVPVPAPDRLGLVRGAVEILARRSGGRRTVVVVDDAHLLDEGTAALVLHLVVRGSAFVIATVRAGEPCLDAVTALWKDHHAPRLDLQALSREEVHWLLEGGLAGTVSDRLARWVYDRSEGNPLFACELVVGGVTGGGIEAQRGIWQMTREPPPSPRLAELLRARLTGISDAERRCLALIALGEPLDIDILGGLAGADILSRLEAGGLARVRRDRDRFVAAAGHPLLADLILLDLGDAGGRELRGALADAMEANGELAPADLVRVAVLRLDGQLAADPQLLTAAAAHAYRAFDLRLAVRLAAAARDEGGGMPAILTLAQALRGCNRADEAEELLCETEPAVAESRGDADYLFTRLAGLLWGVGDQERATAFTERAAGWSKSPAWRHQVSVARAMVATAAGRLGEAVRLAGPLAEDPHTDPVTRGRAATSLVFAMLLSGHSVAAGHTAEVAMSAPTGPTGRTVDWRPLLGWAAVRLGSGRGLDGLEQRLARVHAAAEEAQDQELAGIAGYLSAATALRCGRPVTARRWLDSSIRRLDSCDPRGMLPAASAMRAQAVALAGDHATAQALLSDARDAAAGRVQGRTETFELEFADIAVALAQGDLTRARELALRYADESGEAVLHEAAMLHEAVRAGHPAVQVESRLAALAAHADNPLMTGLAEHAHAHASGDVTALEQVGEAFAESGLGLLAAETAAEASSAARRTGLSTAARRLAARSHALAGRCEGARTPILASVKTIELTPRELEIALLAASNLSNREIASRLVVSPRTVETHIYHVMDKLGVSTRRDLGPLLQ